MQQKIKELDVLQALAKEYLQEDRKGDRENTLTLSVLSTIGALFVGIALGSFSIYQSPQQQQLRALQAQAQRFEKIQHQICK